MVGRGDIEYTKALTDTNTAANGGRMSYLAILSTVKHALFDRVSRQDRINGATFYKKAILRNKSAANDIAYALAAYLLYPTPGGDRIYMAAGTQIDAQGDLTSAYKWYGSGKLNADVTAGAKTLSILFKSNDYYAENAGKIVIDSNFMVSQTVDSAVNPFEFVQYSTGLSKWIRQDPPDVENENMYPYGIFLGGGVVYSENTNGKRQLLTLQNNAYTDEVLAAANGSQTTFSNLAAAHGPINAASLIVKYTVGAVPYTATESGGGILTGTYLTGGSVNYETNDIDLVFSTAPDNSTNIKADYTANARSWSGNVMMVKVNEQASNNMAAANTYVGFCLPSVDVKTSLTSASKISASGVFDSTKITLNNRGTVYDIFTITFTSATAYTCTGLYWGSVGTGTVSGVCAPTNTGVGQPYFSAAVGTFTGTWQAGDTAAFTTNPSALPIWFKQVVPANTDQYSNNGFLHGYET
jgi:hypothetical protein